jgi:hypothetical protein
MKKYRVTIEYIAQDNTEHTIQATFSSLPMALTKSKSTCLKNDVKRVKKVLVEEI